MAIALVKRLEAFGDLPPDEVALLNQVSTVAIRVLAGHDIAQEGSKTGDVHLVVNGYACRYKRLKNGKRQIVAFLLPGEFCDLHVFILKEMDHSISALTDCTIVDIPRSTVLSMLERPALARALMMTTLVDEATLREWVTNVGQRSAPDRIAHLFCELYLRMKVIGAVDGHAFDLPISQKELADTVGLSLVHANKSLKLLREEGAVTFRNRRIVINDIALLEKIAGFSSNYLHLDIAEGQSLASSLEASPDPT